MSPRKNKQWEACVEDFQVKTTIGRGGFAVVYVVQEKKTGGIYAMKVQRKPPGNAKPENVRAFEEEREVLSKAQSPWLTQLYRAFQDQYNFYLVMDYHPGGDLFFLLNRLENVDEGVARFYIAEIVSAVHAVHEMGYVHRDIKPENILFDCNGHVKLVDFGFSTKMNENKQCSSHSLPVGTRDYISPELLDMVDASREAPAVFGPEVDFWSVGVVLYEMLYGNTPFTDVESSIRTIRNILTFKTSLVFPDDAEVSDESSDLIGGLLAEADVRLRYQDIIKHPFFCQLDFSQIRLSTPPHIPILSSQDDTSNFEPIARESIIPADFKALGRINDSRGSLGSSFSANKSRDALNTSLEKMEAKLVAHQQLSLSTTDLEISDLRSQLDSAYGELERERAARDSLIEIHQAQIGDKDKIIKQLEQDQKNLSEFYEKKTVYERADMNRNVDLVYSKMSLLNERLSATKQELAVTGEQLSQALEEKDAAETKLSKLRHSSDSGGLQAQLALLKSSLEEMSCEHTQLTEAVNEKTRLCETQEFCITTLKDRITELKQRLKASAASTTSVSSEPESVKRKPANNQQDHQKDQDQQAIMELTRRVTELAESGAREASAAREVQRQQTDRIQVLCEQLSTMKEEKKDMEKKCDKYMDDRLDMYDKLKQEQAVSKELNQKVNMLTKELDEIRWESHQQVDSEIQSLRRRSDALTENNITLDARLNRIMEEKEHLQETRDQIDADRKELDRRLKEESSAHCANVSRLEGELHEARMSLASMQTTAEEASRQEALLVEKLRLLQTEVDKFRAQGGGDKVLVKDLQNRIRQLTISKEQAEQETKETVVKLDRTTAELSRHRQGQEKVHSQAEGQLAACNKELSELRVSRDELVGRCRQLEGELEELLGQQMQDSRARATVVQLESKLQENLKVYEGEVRSLKLQIAHSANIEKDLNMQISELTDSKRHLEVYMSKMRNNLNKAQHEIYALKEECTDHLTAVNKLSSEKLDLLDLYSDLERRYDTLECDRADLLHNLEDSRAGHEVQLYRLEETNKQQSKLIDFLRGDTGGAAAGGHSSTENKAPWSSTKQMVGSALKRATNRRPSEGAGVLRPANPPPPTSTSTPARAQSGESIGLMGGPQQRSTVKPQHISWSALKQTPRKY